MRTEAQKGFPQAVARRNEERAPTGGAVLAEAHKRQIERMREEIAKTEQWLNRVDGAVSPMLQGHLKASRERIANAQVDGTEMGYAKIKMEMSAHMNLQYLALQEKLFKGVTGLLSNLLKKRFDTVREAIRNSG